MAEIVVFILVFLAVTIFVTVAAQIVVAAGRERSEKLASEASNEGLNIPPMQRFISPAQLFQLRILTASIPGLVLPFVFWACGLHHFVLLLILAGGAAGVGYMVPYWYYSAKVRRRELLFESRILDLTLGLANSLKAGMALPQGLEKVASQMGGPMREELSVVLREYRLGLDLVEALARLQERMPCEDIRLLTSAIRLTTQSGGSLVEVLTQMVEMIRNRTEFQEKLKTLTAQGRFEALAMASAPLAAFILLYLVNPDLMRPLVTTVNGWLAILVALTLETIGFVVIKKIVTIEV